MHVKNFGTDSWCHNRNHMREGGIRVLHRYDRPGWERELFYVVAGTDVYLVMAEDEAHVREGVTYGDQLTVRPATDADLTRIREILAAHKARPKSRKAAAEMFATV